MLTMGLRGTATNSAPQSGAGRPPSGDDFNIFVSVTCVLCQRVNQVGGSASVCSRRLRPPTLQGRSHETCGGRSLKDDVMDPLHTLLVNANNGPRKSDCVNGQRRGVRFYLSVPGSAQSALTGTTTRRDRRAHRPADRGAAHSLRNRKEADHEFEFGHHARN